MHFGILGPLTVDSDRGVPLPVTPTLPRTALALLVANANTRVSADRLIDAMWPQNPPAAALASLYNHIRRLRRLLGATGGQRIHTVASGYLLQAQEHEVDLGRFHEHHRLGLSAHRAGEWSTAREELAAALALWRGDPLADIARPVLEESEQQRIKELRLQALQWRIEAELHLGLHEGVLAELQALAVEYPFLETFHGQLMRALYGAGRHADALDAYQRVRTTLVEELGTAPGAPLRELHQRILRRDPALARPACRPPAERVHCSPTTVPTVGELVGRADQLRLLRGLLTPDAAATVVLTGTAGSGKSALACHLAHQLADRFPDGLLYADLQGSGPQPAVLAEVLGLLLQDLGAQQGTIPHEPQARAARFRSLIAGRRVLLVLDDAASAAQIGPLLPGTGSCAVLVTSRDRLAGLETAHRLALGGLPPEEAAELLAGIVGARRTDAEPQATRQVLDACEGLPLALHIAGLRLAGRPSWHIADLADQLADTGNRLDELSIGDLSVRAAFAAGYRTLAARTPGGATAALVFRLAALWQGPDLSLPAVAALADVDRADCERALESLVDSHLLHSPAPGRYCVRGLLRLFATETTLAVDPPAFRAEALHRLVSWYHHTADAAVKALDGHGPRAHPHPDPDFPARRAMGFSGPQEALHWQRAERANLLASVRQSDAQGLHSFAWPGTRPPAAPGRAREVGDRREDGLRGLHAAADLARTIGDQAGELSCLMDTVAALLPLGRHEEALACQRELMAKGAQAGRWDAVLAARSGLSEVLRLTGRYSEAEFHAELALELAQTVGDVAQEASMHITLGHIRCAYQDFDRALALYREGLALVTDRDEPRCSARCLEAIGDVHAGQGRMQEAREAWHSALTVLNRLKDPDQHGTTSTPMTGPMPGR